MIGGWRFLLTAVLISVAAHVAQAEPYKRSLYKHWTDEDGDCQKTRDEVLIAESIAPVTLDRRGCKVLKGRWYDPYTGRTVTNPRQLQIDHFIPLKEVHNSGGSRWGAARRQAYANDLTDPLTLIAVWGPANGSKGDRDPAKWLPPNAEYHCEYVRTWVAVKARWRLSMDAREKRKIESVLADCPVDLRFMFDPFAPFPMFVPPLPE